MRVLGRAVLVVAGVLAACVVAGWLLGPTVRLGAQTVLTQEADPSGAVVAWVVVVCAAVAGGCSVWLLASTLATTLASLRTAPRFPPPWLLAPPALRAALGLALGTTVGTLAVSPASPVSSHADRPPRPVPVLPGALAGLRLPDRVVGGLTLRHVPRILPPRVRPRAQTSRVRPGDSLWSITDDLLRRPTAVRVARAWPHLYAANRDVIGPDPDLIRPGMRLVVPAPLHRDERGGPR